MSVITSLYSSSAQASPKVEQTKTAATYLEKEGTATTAQGTKVTISGQAMMLSRLFRTNDPNASPAIEYSTTTSNTSGSVYSFLNTDDRKFISKLYEFANSKGIDPLKVDNVAFDLGVYRMYPPGGPPDSTGHAFDLQGNPMVFEFSPSDEAIAQRVLTSKAINDTEVDHGFLQALFNPNRTSVHASDFSFVQEIVFASSDTGADGSADPNAKPIIRPKAEDIPPLELPDQQFQYGNATLLSRLFNTTSGAMSDSAATTHSALFNYLSDTDKTLLGQMYATAEKKGEDLTRIDKLAISLGAYRMRESMLLSLQKTTMA